MTVTLTESGTVLGRFFVDPLTPPDRIDHPRKLELVVVPDWLIGAVSIGTTEADTLWEGPSAVYPGSGLLNLGTRQAGERLAFRVTDAGGATTLSDGHFADVVAGTTLPPFLDALASYPGITEVDAPWWVIQWELTEIYGAPGARDFNDAWLYLWIEA